MKKTIREDDINILRSLEPREHPSRLGIVRAILAGIVIYLIPQFVAGFIIAFIVQLQGVEINEYYSQNSIFVNFVFSVSSALLGLFLIILLTRHYGGLKGIGFKQIPLRQYMLIAPAYIVYFAVLIAVFMFIKHFNIGVDLDQEQIIGFESASQNLQLIFAFIALVICAPIIEEILFRGVLFTNIAARAGFWPAALLISGLFGLAHQQLNVGIDTFLLGIAASWLVWRTHSIYPAILLHMVKNAIAFLILFIL